MQCTKIKFRALLCLFSLEDDVAWSAKKGPSSCSSSPKELVDCFLLSKKKSTLLFRVVTFKALQAQKALRSHKIPRIRIVLSWQGNVYTATKFAGGLLMKWCYFPKYFIERNEFSEFSQRVIFSHDFFEYRTLVYNARGTPPLFKENSWMRKEWRQMEMRRPLMGF